MLTNVPSRRLAQMADQRVLIVEDEFLIALDVAATVEAMGLQLVGFASGRSHALALAHNADIALVDVNLSDGRTGPGIGRELAETYGVTVIFMTANPEDVEHMEEGPLGVLTKPVMPHVVEQSVKFAVANRTGGIAAVPQELKVFPRHH
jgi:DNA-binding response OmpR family regulator